MLVRQTTLSAPRPTNLTPFLPYACSLLPVPKKLIPFKIKRVQPLFLKYRGWGIPDDSAGHPRWGLGNDVGGTRPTGHASRPSIGKVLPTVSPLRPPFPQQDPACAHHRFASSLSALLFPQALSFHNHLRCPIVFSPHPKFHRSPAPKSRNRAPVTPLFATLTHSCSRKSFACHSYENTRDGIPLYSLESPDFRSAASFLVTRHSPLHLSAVHLSGAIPVNRSSPTLRKEKR